MENRRVANFFELEKNFPDEIFFRKNIFLIRPIIRSFSATLELQRTTESTTAQLDNPYTPPSGGYTNNRIHIGCIQFAKDLYFLILNVLVRSGV